jgi:hypothetical protein
VNYLSFEQQPFRKRTNSAIMQTSSTIKLSSPVMSPTSSTNSMSSAAVPDEVLHRATQRRLEAITVVEDCPEECGRWKGAAVIGITGILCLIPIVALVFSAFAAVPGSEPGEDGLASEGSQTMRAFTMGWLFCLALKLRQEFVGLAGSSCFLEPW